ncbi:putative purine permease 11 [Ananas comosus]|uniref:Probable purine permease n=1 Tax=Ananas comosus TaxID=4615 RepID=A0A199VVJ8_ANACO|nr:putative purine permease 11 [Ananas comosus]
MDDPRRSQLHLGEISMPGSSKDASSMYNHSLRNPTFPRWQWWLLVVVNIFFLLAGQTVATLLGRFYYNQGGNSKWMATFVQTAGFPFLFIPLLLFPSPKSSSTIIPTTQLPLAKLSLIYFLLGLIIAADNLMYSYGLLYLPVSTYSLICASQLAFNAIFSYYLNAQKFTPSILNSVVLLTFSAALLGVNDDSGGSTDIPKGKYALGFVLTLGASATYSLILSLMQLTFEKIYTALVATCASVVGLFASGEWRSLKGEMEAYKTGTVSYVMTLVWTAVSWQVASVGVLFASSVFTKALQVQCNAIALLALLYKESESSGGNIFFYSGRLMANKAGVSCVLQTRARVHDRTTYQPLESGKSKVVGAHHFESGNKQKAKEELAL